MVFSMKLWCLAAVLLSLALGQGKAKSATRLPKIHLVNHYEPLSYNTRQLQDKHDRIARGIILEPQIRILKLHFIAYDRSFHLHLQPSRSVFSEGVRFNINGRPTTSYDPASFYEGKLEGDASSHVTGHVINGIFSGVIETEHGNYHIEKSQKYFKNHATLSFHSVIYHENDVEFPEHPGGCGVNGTEWRQLEDLQATAVPINDEAVLSKRSLSISKMFQKSHRRKRGLTSTGGNFCHMRVAVDHLFFRDIGDSSTTDTFAEVVTIFNLVQDIYKSTDFDGDGIVDFITPSIQQFDILTPDDVNYRFADSSTSVNEFLDLWSQDDQTSYCLALLFTNRDFDDGVLGLAWVAQPPGGNRGGVCEDRVRLSVGERSLNTAIVTFTNYGNRQPRPVSVVTIAHELGHNFGSPHDPETSNCSPGRDGGGNFIMYPRATDGRENNNKLFSSCSIDDIRAVLESSKSSCFSSEAFCGNQILEPPEECDMDPCCDNETCTLLPGMACSSQQECCDDNCRIITDNSTMCRIGTECAEPSFCNGTSGACPPSTAFPNGGLCNNGSNVCDSIGNCVGSYCLQFPELGDCQCTLDDDFENDRLCDVCCFYQGECKSTFDLAQFNDPALLRVEGLTLEPGRSCNDFEGYCSQQDSTGISECIVVDNEQTLNDLLDLLSIDTLNEIVAWLTVYWWVAIIVIVAILVLFILLQLTYRKRQPLKRRLSRARNSFRRNSVGGGAAVRADESGRGGGRGGGARRRRDDNRRQISPDDAFRRLSAFFPTAQSDIVRDVIRQSQGESKAVRRMLDLGFPMRKIPIPRA